MILAVFEIPFLEFDDFNPKKIKVPKVSRGFEKSYFLDVFYVRIVFLPQNKPPGTILSPRTSLKSRFFKLGSFQIRTLGSIHIYLKTTPVPSICCDQNSSSFFCVFTTRHFVCTF